ncbi:hypothetical protein OH491_17530 [Termitidicoccus mucosus]|uniref:Uncharacterized protein n=1 Tax=Termitidicoccus mucosus TaxID=1184151 RepID=A0A178IIX1_9BACT|nr:hypothetical protein AW736_11070 [Opitutaceae bacterium TSB47]
MKNTKSTTAAVPMLHVTLPNEIMLPADADINALLRILMGARKIETISRVEIDGVREYDGDDTHYTSGPVVPLIREANVASIHADEAAAIAAKIENVNAEKRRQAEWRARRAAEAAATANSGAYATTETGRPLTA